MPRRRHHEREPRVGDEHDRRAHDVQAEPQAEVHERMEFPPAVVVGVEEERLEEEQADVRQKRRREHAHQVVRELRIERDQHERQERAEGRGEREGDGQQLRELVREPVVAHVSGLVADGLDDEGEDRHGEHERREQEMELRDRPDRDAAADDGEPAIGDLFVGLVLVLGRGGLGCVARALGRRGGWRGGRGGRGDFGRLCARGLLRRRRGRLFDRAELAAQQRDGARGEHECDGKTEKDLQCAVHHGASPNQPRSVRDHDD